MEGEKQIRNVLPCEGLWTVQDFADWLEVTPQQLQEALEAYDIKTLIITSRPKHKLIKMQDVVAKIGSIKHGIQ